MNENERMAQAEALSKQISLDRVRDSQAKALELLLAGVKAIDDDNEKEKKER